MWLLGIEPRSSGRAAGAIAKPTLQLSNVMCKGPLHPGCRAVTKEHHPQGLTCTSCRVAPSLGFHHLCVMGQWLALTMCLSFYHTVKCICFRSQVVSCLWSQCRPPSPQGERLQCYVITQCYVIMQCYVITQCYVTRNGSQSSQSID